MTVNGLIVMMIGVQLDRRTGGIAENCQHGRMDGVAALDAVVVLCGVASYVEPTENAHYP